MHAAMLMVSISVCPLLDVVRRVVDQREGNEREGKTGEEALRGIYMYTYMYTDDI